MSLTMPTFGPLDAAADVAYDLLSRLAAALAPIDGGAATVLAIVLFTAAVRFALIPLSKRQVRAAKAQADLLPRVRDLQQRYRTQPERLRTELARLYAEAGTNPLAPFLPALLQAPAFIVLYHVFTGTGALLSTTLFGVPLTAQGLAAGWVLAGLVGALLAVATVSARRSVRSGQPRWTLALPYLTVVPAVFMPVAAGFYLLTSVTWSAVEQVVLRR
ncbi:YidC/Oxa1 family membrane protein insertase [Virgisporangium ochraceum]|uniref:Membrane protein insertase YidC n=1 Tax=Virgisporangium ochraceum TaxID=65505 RepID=A0A8J4E9C7_9ACTN|nr:membrane protein insertase YidC [Virgisporangium ochraceum]GIJ66309.1 membrane protein [Virgisporangium ochraceum]